LDAPVPRPEQQLAAGVSRREISRPAERPVLSSVIANMLNWRVSDPAAVIVHRQTHRPFVLFFDGQNAWWNLTSSFLYRSV
jgi:hypothetical protein